MPKEHDSELNVAKIHAAFKDKETGREVKLWIIVKDEFAVARYSDIGVAKKIFLADKRAGNKNISFNFRRGIITEKYPGKNYLQIKDYIQAWMIKAGWKHLNPQ